MSLHRWDSLLQWKDTTRTAKATAKEKQQQNHDAKNQQKKQTRQKKTKEKKSHPDPVSHLFRCISIPKLFIVLRANPKPRRLTVLTKDLG